MNEELIYSKLTEIFRDVFDDESIVAIPEMVAADVASWDSLSNIRMIVSVEETLGIRFSSKEISNLENVSELVNAIQKNLGEKG